MTMTSDKTTTIININSGNTYETIHHVCSICECTFSEDEGGLQRGNIGILPVSFCPTCFSGLFSMLDYIRGGENICKLCAEEIDSDASE